MAIEFRTAVPDDVDALVARDLQAFAGSLTAEERAASAKLLDLDRFRVAYDGPDLVGVAGSFGLELTLPGNGIVPMGGTTWVSVAPTHRRRGIVTQLLEQVHDDIAQRGEPIAGLMASEGGIYERFGYGIATRWRVVEIDVRDVQMAQPPNDQLRLVDPKEHVAELHERFDRARRQRPGEVSQTQEWIAARVAKMKQPFAALHDDGYVIWTVAAEWGDAEPAHQLDVLDLVACTPDAYASLWNLLLTVDLVRTVVCRPPLTLDDPLPWLVGDQRGVRTKALHDFLWLRPGEVDRLLAARRYRIEDTMVVEVDGRRWNLHGGPDGAECVETTATPDLTLTTAALGALLLGGVSASELAAGGRLRSEQLGRADAFFGWSPLPHCTTDF